MIGPLKFKGERNYLHGTDIFNAVVTDCRKSYGSGFVSHIEFRTFADTQIRLANDNIGTDEAKIGSCRYECAAGDTQRLDLVATIYPVQDRYEYDEHSVVTQSRIVPGDKMISSPVVDSVSTIEQIVALDKKLHYALWPSPPGRWVFTRLQCVKDIPAIQTGCKIEITKCLPNKFSEGKMQIDGKYVGKITFTVAF